MIYPYIIQTNKNVYQGKTKNRLKKQHIFKKNKVLMFHVLIHHILVKMNRRVTSRVPDLRSDNQLKVQTRNMVGDAGLLSIPKKFP